MKEHLRSFVVGLMEVNPEIVVRGWIMPSRGAETKSGCAQESKLQVYLLGQLDYAEAIALQKRLVYQVSGDRSRAALILCEHPAIISVGREGSWSHLNRHPGEPSHSRLDVHWVNRGGGCFVHYPGQLAFYPIIPLDRLGLGLHAYLQILQEILLAVLDDFNIQGERGPGVAGVWVGRRAIAGLGIAVRDWVSYHGGILNIDCDMRPFQVVRGGWLENRSMTSLARERRGLMQHALVRERFVEHCSRLIPFSDTTFYFDHPALNRKVHAHAVANASGG